MIQIIIFFFDSVETTFTWKASITSSSVILPVDSYLHEGFHHENEPGCSGLGRCFSRPYFNWLLLLLLMYLLLLLLLLFVYLYYFIYCILSFYMSTLYCCRMKMWIVQQPVPMLLKTCIDQIGGHP